MKIFKRLQLKFILIPLIIGGVLLSVVFCTIFGISYIGTQKSISFYIEKALNHNYTTLSSSNPFDNNTCMIVVKTEQELIVYNSQYDNTTENEIIQKAFSKTNKFLVNTKNFRMGYKNAVVDGQNAQIFAIYDYTDSLNNLILLGNSLFAIYFSTLAILAIISYLFSTSAVKPIRDAFYKQKKLVANASHELKTPLTVISTNLDLVVNDTGGTIADNIKWIESARYQLSRMNNLILQMLELSSLDSPNRLVVKESVNISHLCEGILLSFEAICFEKNVNIHSTIQPNIVLDLAKTEIEKLITILVDNAVKYTPQNQNIYFDMSINNRKFVLSVKNTGVGMSQTQLENIFERFYKTDNSRQESGNSFGLGLSIAKSLALSMNGDIFCTSQIDEWTCFKIILPI